MNKQTVIYFYNGKVGYYSAINRKELLIHQQHGWISNGYAVLKKPEKSVHFIVLFICKQIFSDWKQIRVVCKGAEGVGERYFTGNLNLTNSHM